ncbi:MAG: ankyrin repeat domain-containing protein [Pyrinomonadaceae bacterium]|nr:ankyrin repeat domain-containing protein [Pyrinomonadaceae bacterium]
MRKTFIISLFISLFSIIGNAQGAVSYKFLEVVDYADKPVAEAKIKIQGGCVGGEVLTNEKGRVDRFPVGYGDCHTDTFNISKDGYYPFTDLFGVIRAIGGSSESEPTKVELLKIPNTKAERQAVEREQLKREFFAAARSGDNVTVRKLIKSGFSPNLTTSELRGIPGFKDVPIIIFAVDSGDGGTVKEFLAAGVKVNKPDEPIKSILIQYLSAYPVQGNFPDTEAGNTARISAYENGAISLIDAGASLEPKYSTTPLMVAAQKFYFRIVKRLIEKGVSVDAQDNYGRTALMHLIDYYKPKERLEIAEFLIKSGAKVNLLTSHVPYSRYDNQSCNTALSIFVQNYDVEMVKLLLANGADVNLTCKGGNTPLNYAKDISQYGIGGDKKEEIIKILEAAGAK